MMHIEHDPCVCVQTLEKESGVDGNEKQETDADAMCVQKHTPCVDRGECSSSIVRVLNYTHTPHRVCVKCWYNGGGVNV